MYKLSNFLEGFKLFDLIFPLCINFIAMSYQQIYITLHLGEFPGALVVRIQCLHHYSPVSIPGLGTEIQYQAAALGSQKKKKNGKSHLVIHLTYHLTRELNSHEVMIVLGKLSYDPLGPHLGPVLTLEQLSLIFPFSPSISSIPQPRF